MNKNSNVKILVLILTSVFLLQSCKIYRKKTATTDEALDFQKRVKVVTSTNKTYKFKKLIKEDGQFFGLTKRNSKIAKELSDLVSQYSYKKGYVKISLSDDFIKEIHLLNKPATVNVTAVTINAAVISFWAALLIGSGTI